MFPYYMPILKVLAAEIRALSKSKANVSNKILPLLEIPKITKSISEKKCYQSVQNLTLHYLQDKISSIADAWKGRAAMVDAFHWPADAKTEDGDHVIPHVYNALEALGVPVIPVIGYDRWESFEYSEAIIGLSFPADRLFCLRLDSTAIEDSADPEFLLENVQKILADISVPASRCILLIDFGTVFSLGLDSMLDKVNAVLSALAPIKFYHYSVAGCSLPPTIDGAVKKTDTTANVLRREMVLWQSIRDTHVHLNISFGDYGVRAPTSNDGIPNPHTNGKIRYTIIKNYMVARGHSMQLPGKGEQMWMLAEKIVNSGQYLGSDFSWGDEQILECSNKGFKGTAGHWIAVDTNHHLAFVVAEIDEVVHKAPHGAFV